MKNFAGVCEPPELAGVTLTGTLSAGGESWVGGAACSAPHSLLVGASRIKCRAGVWSSAFPVCTGGDRNNLVHPA